MGAELRRDASAAGGAATDTATIDRLLPLVYEELKWLAHRKLRHERADHTLNTTALVHEAYVKLAEQTCGWLDRSHFLGVAARAMQQVLVDMARRHRAAKRGGQWRRVTLDADALAIEVSADALLALDDALERLGRLSERMRGVVECRFFAGMTEAETAVALGTSERTVRREWQKARLWLCAELAADVGGALNDAPTAVHAAT